MTREPNPDERRLDTVTAQNPGTVRAHETHDRLLVARFALGDGLAPDEAGAVRALLATCGECATLVAEMQVVQHATATSIAPVRPRDFRITAGQAATLRPSAWRRFLGRLAAPDLSVLRPLAGATLAMGIVLVGVGAVLPKPDEATPAPKDPSALTVEASPAGAGLAGSQASDMQASPEAAQRDINTTNAKESPGSGGTAERHPDGSVTPRMMVLAQSPGPDATITAYAMPQASLLPVTDNADVMVASSTLAPAEDTLGPALLLLGVVLAVVSTLVLVLAWLARRDVDPLLR